MITTLVVKLNIIVANSSIIENSTQVVPNVLQQLNETISKLVESFGFVAVDFNPRISNRNGGWAFYRTYVLESDNYSIRLIIDIRTADHPSRPSLAVKNEKRFSALSSEAERVNAQPKLMDIYYKQGDRGVQYFIGKGDNYSDPVSSIAQVRDIVQKQIEKLVNSYST